VFIDEQTIADLEIFQAQGDGLCLFDFCNQTRTNGGEQRLRQRMAKPLATAEAILDTQQAINFISEHRQRFDAIRSRFSSDRIQHYLHDAIPIIEKEDFIQFSVSAYAFWATNERHFSSIVQGVQFVCKFIQRLQRFLAELESPAGELKPLIRELRELLEHPRLKLAARESDKLSVWQTLRHDRNFRVYELQTLERLLRIIDEIDALVSMADTCTQHGFCTPQIVNSGLEVHAEGIFHPYLKKAIRNHVDLNENARGIFLTGPNMAGKTTYLRAFALVLYFGHLGMGVPARQCRFSVMEGLYSAVNLKDNIHSGISYFRAEALRVKDIAEAMVSGRKIVALLDEPFKGTNVQDTYEASKTILEHFCSCDSALFMFTSHQIELGEQLEHRQLPLRCFCFTAIESEARLRFDYTLKQGVSKQRIGVRVLKEEGVFQLFKTDLE
jgi:DNA mismatch repair protein MutS